MPMNVYSAFCVYLGFASGALGNFKHGEPFCEKGLQYAIKLGDPRSIAYVELWYGYFLNFKGAWEIAVEHWRSCIKYCEEIKWLFALGLAWGNLGDAVTYLDDPQTGLEYIQKGLKIQSSTGVKSQLAMYYCCLGNAHFALGDLKNAMEWGTKALKLALDNNEKGEEGYSRIFLGRIMAKSDPSQTDRAEETILKGINIMEELRVKPYHSLGYLYLGEIYVDTGQRDKALEVLKKAESMFKEMEMDYRLERTKEVIRKL
jgi:tetratricopeptide (TPR) repeat protein